MLKNRIVVLTMQTTSVETVKEVWLYDGFSLVAEVGGSMGLFLGASLVSMFEWALNTADRAVKWGAKKRF